MVQPCNTESLVLRVVHKSLAKSYFSLEKPLLAEDAACDLASDDDIADFLQSGKQALSSEYVKHMKGVRRLPYGSFDLIQRCIFSSKTYHILLQQQPKTHAALNVDETPDICYQFFLFIVAALEHSLGPLGFTSWFTAVFGPPIEAAARVLRETADMDDESQERRSKKARRLESRYSRSLSLFRRLLELHAEGREKCATEQIPEVPLRGFSSTASFIPTLSPSPPPMPGAWIRQSSPPHPLRRRTTSTPAPRRTAYSRFARLSTPPVHHFVPLLPGF